jgi:chaperone required for assembly of F1-ATPase
LNLTAAKRFYKSVGTQSADGGFAVTLDGRHLRSPAGAALLAPTLELAKGIAEEWDAQGETIDAQSMPLMRLMSTAIDRVAAARAQLVDQVVAYAATDLLCYWVEQPADLALRQKAVWQTLLDWADRTYGARLNVTTGIIPVKQPEDALGALRRPVEDTSDFELTALSTATAAASSLVVGLAMLAEEIDAGAAFEAAELDSSFQIERWGEDPEAAQRRDRLRADFKVVERFLYLGRGR